MLSSSGRYGTAKKTFISSKPVYSKFTLPNSIIIGDNLDIPITVYNNREEQQSIVVQVEKDGEID